MNEEKNIDRLFQEKLKDFEVTPKDAVWENIAARVQPKKKKRRVIPIWLRLSGVAAGLILLISLGNSLFFNDAPSLPIENDTIVNENVSDQKNATDEFKTPDTISADNTNAEEDLKNSSIVLPEKDKAIANNKNELAKQSVNSSKKTLQVKTDEARIAENNKIATEATIDKADAVVENTKEVIEAIAENKEDETKEDDVKKESILDAVASQEDAVVNTDEDPKTKRWSVSPIVAPVYFNTLGEGSSIHSDFVSNPKTGDVNMSYGITASYAINKKVSVRAGVNKVQLGYSTNDILVFNSLSSAFSNSKFKNIALNKKASDMAFANANSFNDTQTPFFISGENASIDQQLGFLEVPLELEYKLLDNKFGLHIVGGFSTLFLESNDIYSVFDGQSTLIGEATNINKTSYSANLGLGLDYKVSDKFKLNLEPVFKYQLNTFTNTSGEFRPYFIGFYTGLSFKF